MLVVAVCFHLVHVDIECEINFPSYSCIPTYILVTNNLDKSINPRFMTSENQHQSLHYIHSYAVLDRVNCFHLPYDAPVGDIKELGPSTFLPSAEDSFALRHNYSVLLSRVIVKRLPFFEIFKDCVNSHILHEHSDEMSIVVSTSLTLWFYLHNCG